MVVNAVVKFPEWHRLQPTAVCLPTIPFGRHTLCYLRQGRSFGVAAAHAHDPLYPSSIFFKVKRREAEREVGSVVQSVYSIWTGPKRADCTQARRRRWGTKGERRRSRTRPRATESPWRRRSGCWAPALSSSVSVWQLLFGITKSAQKDSPSRVQLWWWGIDSETRVCSWKTNKKTTTKLLHRWRMCWGFYVESSTAGNT